MSDIFKKPKNPDGPVLAIISGALMLILIVTIVNTNKKFNNADQIIVSTNEETGKHIVKIKNSKTDEAPQELTDLEKALIKSKLQGYLEGKNTDKQVITEKYAQDNPNPYQNTNTYSQQNPYYTDPNKIPNYQYNLPTYPTMLDIFMNNIRNKPYLYNQYPPAYQPPTTPPNNENNNNNNNNDNNNEEEPRNYRSRPINNNNDEGLQDDNPANENTPPTDNPQTNNNPPTDQGNNDHPVPTQYPPIKTPDGRILEP